VRATAGARRSSSNSQDGRKRNRGFGFCKQETKGRRWSHDQSMGETPKREVDILAATVRPHQ
jgi:hypothetical protein